MDYIKKLRACIRSFQELNTTQTQEKEELSKQIENEKQSRSETGAVSIPSWELSVHNKK